MMRFPPRTLIVLLLLSFAAGFITSFLIFEDYNFLKQDNSKELSTKSLKKEAISSEASYQKQIETLTSQNVELQQQMEVSQGLLEDAKNIAGRKEDHIKELIRQSKSSSPKGLEKSFNANPQRYLPNGQTGFLQNSQVVLLPGKEDNYCDSLAQEVTTYIADNKHKDSIYELQLTQFDSLLSNKDVVIETSRKAYDDLKILFDKSLFSQATLQKENLQLASQNKRQKFKSKVLKGALLLFSGFTANYIIPH
jgi:hypothetical protein